MLKVQECNICGVQIFSDIFECEKCDKAVCEECVDKNLDICIECK